MKTCTLVFLLRGDEILLAMKKRGFGAGYWNGVGGKVDTGETIQQAAIRECQEEIGVAPTNLMKVAEHTFIFPKGSDDIFVHAFTSRTWEGKPIETEEMAPQWFKVNEVPYEQMWQDDIVWLPLVQQGKKLKTTFTFDGGNNMLDARLEIVKEI